MRATSLSLRLLAAGLVSASLWGCAEGGLSEAELNGEDTDTDTDEVVARDGGRTSNRDAGKDARASGSDDDEDRPSTGSGGGTGSGSGSGTKRPDAGTGSGSGSGGGGKDAGTGGGSGGGTAGAAIKCPTSMACNNSLASILSIFDTSITASSNLCVLTGSALPSAPSCKTDAECVNARLTTAKCSVGSCIQPCTP